MKLLGKLLALVSLLCTNEFGAVNRLFLDIYVTGFVFTASTNNILSIVNLFGKAYSALISQDRGNHSGVNIPARFRATLREDRVDGLAVLCHKSVSRRLFLCAYIEDKWVAPAWTTHSPEPVYLSQLANRSLHQPAFYSGLTRVLSPSGQSVTSAVFCFQLTLIWHSRLFFFSSCATIERNRS